MVDQSQEHENVSGTIFYKGLAGFVYNTVYNYLTEYEKNNKLLQVERRYKQEFCNQFGNGNYDFSEGDCEDFYKALKNLHDNVKNRHFARDMDSITKFKLLRLTHLYGDDALKIEEGVIQHIEAISNRHSYYMMYEPLRSFDDFEGSVGDFCQLNPKSSGLYITPIFQNNKFYLGLVNIEDGQFDKNEMKIYAPQNKIFQGNEQACIDAIENIISNSTDIESSNDFRNFSDFQKENTQRDFSDDDAISTESDSSSSDEPQNQNTQRDSSDDDGSVVELVTTSSDEFQDIPYTQHSRFEFDNYPFNTPPSSLPQFSDLPSIPNMPPYNSDSQNMPLYHQGSQNMHPYEYSQNPVGHDSSNGSSSYFYDTPNRENSFFPNTHGTGELYDNDSGAGFREVSLDEEYKGVKHLLQEQACFHQRYNSIFAGQIGKKSMKSHKDIKFGEIFQCYDEYKNKISLEPNDVKILQTLCGLEQGANFSIDSDGNTYMTKENDSNEDICVCTTPVSYDDERFRQILQNFLKTHQNFSGIFVITCNNKKTNDSYSENGWFLTTCQIENGRISDTHANPIQYGVDDFTRGMGVTYGVNQLLSNQSYEKYKSTYPNNPVYSMNVQSLIHEVNFANNGHRTNFSSAQTTNNGKSSLNEHDPFAHLRIPWDPQNNWKPLPINDDEFETERDCPFPFEWDDPDPLTLDDRIDRMIDVLNDKDIGEPNNTPSYTPEGIIIDNDKPIIHTEEPSKPRYILYSDDNYKNTRSSGTYVPQRPGPGRKPFNTLPPQFGNLPPIPNMPPYNPGPQNPYRGNPNFDLYDTPNNMPQFYVCDGFDESGYQLDSNNRNLKDTEYYFRSCRRNSYTPTRFFPEANDFLKEKSIQLHGEAQIGKRDPEGERVAFTNSWSGFIDDKVNSFESKLHYLENGRMLNLYDIRLLQLYYAEEVKQNTQDQVIYHFDALEQNDDLGRLMLYNSLITEIKKEGKDLSYFMMPVMTGGFNHEKGNFKKIEAMVDFLPSHLVQDGVYLIPTNGREHWELTCVKKQGDVLEYFVTSIGSNGNNCGVNTTRAMQYVIENGYEAAKQHYRHEFDKELHFGERKGDEEEYVIRQEEPLEPHYAPDFDRDQSWDNRYMGFSDTYAPQRPGPGRKIEPQYFNIFTKFIESGTSWTNYHFSFEDAQLDAIFQDIKDNGAWNNDIMRRNLRERFDQVSSSNGGKIALQYNDDQGRQIKETIDLTQIRSYDRPHDYNSLNEEEKKLTQFLFHCEVAEMMKIAKDLYGNERIPDIKLDDIFNSGEACNVQIGQKQIGFNIREPEEAFFARAADILCTNVGVIRDTLSHNYFQDNLTISVDGGGQEITSASKEKDIQRMYFDIVFNEKSFTCTVLGKQRKFDHLLMKGMAVDNVVASFESAHLVTGFDALSADIEKKHGKITYKVEDRELDKENFLLALYDQTPCTMLYYVNGEERRIRYDTKTGWQKAIETMQEDAKADGLEAYKQQIRSSTILQQIKTDNDRKFGGNGAFSCEIVLANDDCTNKNLSTILPNCLEEDGSVNFKFKVHGREYILEPREWSHGQSAGELSKTYEQQIASCYIASSIFNSDVDKIKINGQEIEINKTDGSDNYQAVQRRLHTALQNKEYIELFIGEKQSTIFTKQNVIKNTDNALTEVRLGAKEVQIRVDAFKNALLTRYDDDLQCFIEESGNKFYFIDENGVNCTKDIHDKGRDLKAQDLRNCKIREQQFDEDASYDIDFYDNVLSGRIDIIKKDIEYAHDRFFLLHDLDDYRSKGQEDDTEYTYKFLKDGIEQTKHDNDTKTQLIYKHKSGQEIIYTLPAFNNPDGYDIDIIAEIIPEFKPATQDVQVFNDMIIDQKDEDDKVYIKVNGEQIDDCYIEGLRINKKLNTLQDKFDFLTRNGRLLTDFPRLIKLSYKDEKYICSHKFEYDNNWYITRDNFQKNFDNFATILDMQEQGFIQVQYSDGSPCNNQGLYKAICYKKNVGREENKTVQIVYGDKKIDLEPDKGYDIISAKLTDIKEQQKQDVEELQKALNEAGLELKTTARNHKLYIQDKTSKQAYFFGIEGGDYLAINGKEYSYVKLLNTRENVKILDAIGNPVITIPEAVTINSIPNFKKCLNAIVQNELNDTLNKYTEYVQEVDRTFGFEDAPDPTSPEKRIITLCGNQTIKYDPANVKSIRDAQKKVERAPHPLLAQGISGGFLENSLIVDDKGYVKIKPKNCIEEYQLFTRQGGHDQPVQDDAFKGKNTKEILDTICQNYSIDSDTQIYAKNEDDIATVAIPLYASTARAGDKGGFFDSFYQSFEKLELYNRLKKIRADGDESKMEIRHDDYGYTTLINSVNQLTNIFKSQDIVSVKCQYGESNKEFSCPLLRTNYDNPLDDNTFNNVDQYIENTINSKPSRDAEEVLSQIKYDAGTHKTTINGREIYFYKVGNNGRGRAVRIEPVEDSGKRGYLDYKKLHKNVKSFKDTDKLRVSYETSDGSRITSGDIGFEDSSLKEFVDRVDLADQIYQMQNSRKIKNLEIFDASTRDNIDINGKNTVQIYNLIKNKDNLSIKFKTRGQSIRTKIKCNAGGLRKLKRIQKVTTKTITDNKDLVDVKDFDMPVEVDTDVDNEIIQESESQLINKNYDPFEDIENNPELRKLVELFIEQSDPDMLATIKNNELITCLNSGTIIRNFRNSAKYEKDYLANSPDATNTMEYIKELDEILKKDGDFYDKCNCYDDTGIKLSKTNLHELQLLAIQEYLQSHDTQKAKYFTSDKANGPNYIYLEDKKMLISLSPEKYDDSKCDNKELEELLKNTSITKVTTKKEGDDWVLDCYLDKDKEHLIVDSRNDGRQYDNVSGGIWAARATNEIIELGVENFQILNTYRQTVQDYPEFLKGETGEDLNRIKLSMREFKRCKEG